MIADFEHARTALLARILEGEGHAPAIQRRAAFNLKTGKAGNDAELAAPLATLIDKVANASHKVTDKDIAAARASGLTEDQIFELVVCAAVGDAARLRKDSVQTWKSNALGRKHPARDLPIGSLGTCASIHSSRRLIRHSYQAQV